MYTSAGTKFIGAGMSFPVSMRVAPSGSLNTAIYWADGIAGQSSTVSTGATFNTSVSTWQMSQTKTGAATPVTSYTYYVETANWNCAFTAEL